MLDHPNRVSSGRTIPVLPSEASPSQLKRAQPDITDASCSEKRSCIRRCVAAVWAILLRLERVRVDTATA